MVSPEKRAAILEKILAAPDLPSPSAPALALVKLTQDENVSLRQLEQAIQLDPAFVARLIKVANSARYGTGGRPVASVKDALIVLGLPAIRGLAVGFSLLDTQRKSLCPQFDSDAFWVRSVVMALAFQRISASIKAAPADEAFCIGLLASIGTLALAVGFPGPYGRLLDDAKANPEQRIEDIEIRALGFSHWEVSAELMSRWGLPPVYARPVASQPTGARKVPLDGRVAQLCHALSLAGIYADLIVERELRSAEKLAELYVHGARVSLEAESLLALGKEIGSGIHQWTEMLGLSVANWVSFDWVEEAERNPRFFSGKDAKSLRALKLLVVEDDRASSAMLETLLRAEGYAVTEARSGREALELAEQMRPDIVLTDWVMPEMDGVELIRRLRALEWGQHCYALVLTGNTAEEHLIEAFAAGADDFITKPIKPRVLVARLRAGERMLRMQLEAERQFNEMRELAGELSESNRLLQELAVTDALTGCPNRRYALERLQQDWSAAERHGQPLSCLVIDLDYFKQVNDAHGHERGDEVLRTVAQALRDGLRNEDVICRVGGDEFWVICPNVSRADAAICAERLCRTVDRLKINAGDLQCTISVGVAERHPEMSGPAVLIEAADKNLYLAKRAGRARVA